MRHVFATIRPAIAVAALLSSPVCAGPRHIAGAGGEACRVFVGRAGSHGLGDHAALQWVMGYLTGRSTAGSISVRHKSFRGPEGIAADVLAYCRSRPEAQVDQAAASFFDDAP